MAARRSPDQVRDALTRAAAVLFARDGFDGVNSNQIAREAGVGVGTFYRHFDDKPALADALMLQVWDELGATMPGPDVDEPLEFARSATEAVVAYAARQPDRFRAAFGNSRRSNIAPSMRPLERRFRQLVQNGAVADIDPAVAARAWWCMLSGTLVWWLEDQSRAPADQLADVLTRLHPMVSGRVTQE